MGLLHRKTRAEQLLKAVGASQLPSALAGIRPPKAVTSGLAAAAVVTAGSAGVWPCAGGLRDRGAISEADHPGDVRSRIRDGDQGGT